MNAKTGDQAGRPELRIVDASSKPSHPEAGFQLVAVVSGKGGVGKSNLALNLGLALSDLGKQVLVVDGDFGLGKLDLLLGAQPTRNLGHVILDSTPLEDAVFTGPQGVAFLPGAFGDGDVAVLNALQREHLLNGLRRLDGTYDMVLMDLASGIGPNAMELAREADRVLLVTTPEPTAYADAYAVMKDLSHPFRRPPLVIVNRARNYTEARDTFVRLSRTAQRHLRLTPKFLGYLIEEQTVGDAVRRQKPFLLTAPTSPASLRVREIARRLAHNPAGDFFPVREGIDPLLEEPTTTDPVPGPHAVRNAG